MINSYPASLITVAAAVTEACLLHAKKQLGIVKHKKSKVSEFLILNDKQTHLKTGVGIKFDNILARKYFVLIQSTQERSALDKTIEKVI